MSSSRSRSSSSRNQSSSETAARSRARLERLNQLLFEELSSLVDDELRDPSFEGVRLTGIELSVDSRMARVHFVASRATSDADREAIDRAFVRATSFLRSRLAELVELKRVPDLRFVFQGFVADRGDT